jgi:glycine dehydrogenase subunit 2
MNSYTGCGVKGLEIDEPLIFTRSDKGISAVDFFSDEPSLALSDDDALDGLKPYLRGDDNTAMPELLEPEVVRHYTRLSKKNCAIDISSYPLGSCTMKYNPKIHEWLARLPGLADLHPYMPKADLEPAFRICYELQEYLSEIGGFAATSLAPSAGAHGEFAGMLMITKALKERGENRSSILVPKTAHGTNPATAAFFGYEVVPLDIGEDGRIIVAQVEKHMNDRCAGIMITNPNTLGIFESEQGAISEIIHERGGYVYGDGANLNAMMGIVRPGDLGVDVMHFNLHKTMTTPHGGGGPGCGALGASKELSSYLPIPMVVKRGESFELMTDAPRSIGRIRSFLGNFGMMVRAWAYIRSLGPEGLKMASEYAVLHANYIKERLKPFFHLPYTSDCLHEVVFSDKMQEASGVATIDIAKRLIDYGLHPPTIYFPLVVKGALMIEPTETESLYDLERMIEAFIAVANEAKTNATLVKSAPHHTSLARLDEAKAARNPVLSYQELREIQKL